jgi:hypothetical protein
MFIIDILELSKLLINMDMSFGIKKMKTAGAANIIWPMRERRGLGRSSSAQVQVRTGWGDMRQ